MTASSVYLSPAPLYHAAGVNYTMAVNRVGAASIIMRKFDAEAVLRLIETHRRHACPVRADDVRADAEAAGRGPASATTSRACECVIHAAAPCPVDVKHRMMEWFGPDHSRVLRRHRGIRGHDDRPRGVARPPWLGRQAVDRGACGRRRRGPSCRSASPGSSTSKVDRRSSTSRIRQKTASVSNDRGWRSLGDMGYVDEDGYLYLTDRSTFMIVSGGVNIYPQEAENLLVMHPKLVDAAVFGVPNEEFGEEVKAVVQPVGRRRGRARTRGRTDRVLPGTPRHVQMPAHSRIRSRAAPRPERKALQEAHPRALLAGEARHGSCDCPRMWVLSLEFCRIPTVGHTFGGR